MKRSKVTWKDLIFAEIDGYNAIAIAVLAGLAIIDGAMFVDKLVQYIVANATRVPPVF